MVYSWRQLVVVILQEATEVAATTAVMSFEFRWNLFRAPPSYPVAMDLALKRLKTGMIAS
jgi:hypothetical protein